MSHSSISPRRRFNNPQYKNLSLSSTSRYSHTSHGTSVHLKVVPNAEVSPNEHFKTMSVRSSDY
jgi:hypothetical protein